jgi:hypothetical protein
VSAFIINGVTYDGAGGNPRPPSKVEKAREKAGKSLKMASGLRVFIGAGTPKNGWRFSWANANEATRAAVGVLPALTTTFTLVDQSGASHTVQMESDEQTEATAFTTATNAILYDLTLVLWQGN